MLHEQSHPSNEELLLVADGELSAHRAKQVRAHLDACRECRARMSAMEGAIAGFVRAHRGYLDPQVPPAAGPHALLKARLTGLAARPAAERQRAAAWSPAWCRTAYAGAGLLCAVLLFLALATRAVRHPGERRLSEDTVAAPKTELTPGATLPVTTRDVCEAAPPGRAPVVPASVRHRVFEEYGIPDARPDAYEVDYLITPELGGSDNIRNLWPQPYSAPVWNAYVKDALEDRLHELVCRGQLDLATAQRDISRDWIAAYKKYFHTDKPLSLRQ